jgi:hypothetical protein
VSTASGIGTAVTPGLGQADGVSDAHGYTAVFFENTEVICVHAEDRTMRVEAEPRTMKPLNYRTVVMSVGFEDRTMKVAPKVPDVTVTIYVRREDRTMKAGPRKRVC